MATAGASRLLAIVCGFPRSLPLVPVDSFGPAASTVAAAWGTLASNTQKKREDRRCQVRKSSDALSWVLIVLLEQFLSQAAAYTLASPTTSYGPSIEAEESSNE